MSTVLQGYGPSSGTGSGNVIIVAQPVPPIATGAAVAPGIQTAATTIAIGVAGVAAPALMLASGTVTVIRGGAVISVQNLVGSLS